MTGCFRYVLLTGMLLLLLWLTYHGAEGRIEDRMPRPAVQLTTIQNELEMPNDRLKRGDVGIRKATYN